MRILTCMVASRIVLLDKYLDQIDLQQIGYLMTLTLNGLYASVSAKRLYLGPRYPKRQRDRLLKIPFL